jgi:hypothetical protein
MFDFALDRCLFTSVHTERSRNAAELLLKHIYGGFQLIGDYEERF